MAGQPNTRHMRLTAELVSRVPPPTETFPEQPHRPGFRVATDDDHVRLIETVLAGANDPNEIWVFAYGSLIWRPAFEHDAQRTVVAHGWRRTFCLGWDTWFRGCKERPGLMLALDRGGQCTGIIYRLRRETLHEELMKLMQREARFVPYAFPARWISVMAGGERIQALTFVIDRTMGAYVSGLDDDAVADVLSAAVGSFGSMAEYLHSTVEHLEQMGIHDRHLWKLQDMVAARLEAMPALPETGHSDS